MKKILSFIFLFALFTTTHAQEGIYGTVRVKDSLRLTNIKAALLNNVRNSPQLRFGSNTWDTINNVSRWTEWNIFNETYQGNAIVNHGLVFRAVGSGIRNMVMYPNGTSNFGNGLSFSLNQTIYSAGATMNFVSNSSTQKFNFSNTVGPMNANGVLAKFASVGENGNKAKIIEAVGNATSPVFNVWGENTVSTGTNNPSFQAQIDAASTGKGILIPRMNTAQMLGIPKRIATVTLTDPGAGFHQFAPRVFVNSPVGGINARISVLGSFSLAGGTVTGVQLNYGGSGYYVNDTLRFDTTGTGATVMPRGTYTVTTDTIAESMLVYNTDSLCFFFYKNSTGLWQSLCSTGSGGGGSPQTFENVLNTGSTITSDHSVDDNGANHQFCFGCNVPFLNLRYAAANHIFDGTVNFNDPRKYQGVLLQNNATDKMQVVDIATGIEGYREIPVDTAHTLFADTTDFIHDGDTLKLKNRNGAETTTTIDLSLGDYTITYAGFYKVTNANGGVNSIIFPNPTSYSGQSITIWNADPAASALFDNTNTFAPILGGGTTITDIPRQTVYQYKSGFSSWVRSTN